MAQIPGRSSANEGVEAVLARLREEAVRCGLLARADEPDPVLRTLLEGFGAEIAALRLELEHSLEENRHNLLAHFLGLGFRRQPAQGLVALALQQSTAIDSGLVLTGRVPQQYGADRREFRLPGRALLPAMSLGAAAYTGPGGLLILDADREVPSRSREAVALGEVGEPGPPCLHFGLSGSPPRTGEVLVLAIVPPEESFSRLSGRNAELATYRAWVRQGTFRGLGARSLPPPLRLEEALPSPGLSGAVSDRLPTREAIFQVLWEKHFYENLLFVWHGPLGELLPPGPPPEALTDALRQLDPKRADAYGATLRWLTLALPNLPGGDPLRLIKRVAVNALPAVAYELLPMHRHNVSMETMHPVTGVLPIPLAEEIHAFLQRDDWVVDSVESGGVPYCHVHEHPKPGDPWYALVSDSRSSTLYIRPGDLGGRALEPVDLQLGRLVGEEANQAELNLSPYNRTEYPGVSRVARIVNFVGGTRAHAQDIELPWEGIGAFLRTRDRLVTRWDYEGFVLRFDPRIVECTFRNVALPREGRFVPGVAVVLHFDASLELDEESMRTAAAALANELENRAALGTHLDVRVGDCRRRGEET